MKKLYFFYFFLFVLSTSIFAQKKIIVGIDSNYPPYEYVNEEGLPVGFNVELISYVLDEFNYDYKFVSASWENVYAMFKNGKIDVLSMFYSKFRNTSFLLSTPHNRATYSIFFHEKNEDILTEFNSHTDIIVVREDIMHEFIVENNLPNPITTCSNAEEALIQLNKGRNQLALLPTLQTLYHINEHSYNNINVSNLQFFNQKYCFAVNKNKNDLLFHLNEGLSIIREKGIYDELYEKWFFPYKKHSFSLMYTLKEYSYIFFVALFIFLIVVAWNLNLKRAVNRRNKELMKELMARERSEMAIVESEERFRTLTENSTSAIFIFNRSKIFYVNKAAVSITGYEKEVLLKMSIFELFGQKEKNTLKEIFDKKTNYYSSSQREYFELLPENNKSQWIDISFVHSYYKAEPVIIGTAFDVTFQKTHEDEILESKRVYSTLLDNLPGMAYRCKYDKHWTMLFISDGCLKLTGYSPSEMLNNESLTFNDVIHPEDREKVWNIISESFKTSLSFKLEFRIISKLNEVKWVWEQGRIVKSENIEFIEGYIVDITESIVSKEALSKERQQLQIMLRSIGDGVISTDTNGNIIMLNAVAENLTGWTQQEAIGRPLEDVFYIVNEYTGERCFNPAEKVIKTGQIIGLANHTKLISKTKHAYIISDSAAPILNEDGKISGVVIVFRDSTEAKKYQDRLIESERELKATIDVIPDLIFRNDIDGFFTDYHAGSSEDLKISREKVIGSHISELFDKAFAENIVKSFRACIQNGESQIVEYYFNSPEGKKEFYEARIVKYNDNEVISLCRNITERKQAENEINKNLKQQIILSELSTLFNSNESFNLKISQAFDILGNFFKVCRVYLMENFDDNAYCKNTFEWCANPEIAQINNLQKIPYENTPTLYKSVIENQIFVSGNIDDDLDGDELRFFKKQEIKSIIVIPINVNNKFWGSLGFDVCSKKRYWTTSETEFLRTVSNVIAASIERNNYLAKIEFEREQFETTLYSIGEGVVVTDTLGRITLFNNEAEKLTACSKSEAVGSNISEILNLVDIKTQLPKSISVDDFFNNKEDFNSEKLEVLISQKNQEYIISRNTSPVRDTDGNIIGFVIAFRDNTHKERTERIIRESEENYRKLFDSANDVIFIIKGYDIVNCNEKTLKTLGYKKDEIMGKTPAFISPKFQADGFDSEEKAKMYIDKALSGEPLYFEWDHMKKDGSIVNCEISLNRLDLESGKFLQAIVRDISQRKIYEKALEESEEKYKTLVEKANDGIAIVQDNTFIFANNKLCELTGYNPEEVIGHPFLSFIEPSLHEMILKYNKARLERLEGVPSIYEIVALHKSGKKLFVELNSNYINYYGKPAALVVIRDIGERKDAEDKLKIFKATIENSSDAIGMSTPEGVHIYQNKAFDDLFGPLKEGIVNSIYKDKNVKEEVFKTIMNGGTWTGEVEMISKDSQIRHIFLRAYANHDKNNLITGLVGIHTDITEKKQIENELLGSEEKFRMLLEMAADAFFQGDNTGLIITVNDEAVNLTGYSREELLTLNLQEIFTKESIFKKPLQYKSLEEGKVFKAERELLRKDGKIVYVEMNSRKMPDSTYQSFIRDISSRKLAEKALVESEIKYRLIVDYTPDAIVIHKNGKIVYANNAAFKLMGAKVAEDLIGCNTIDFVHPDFRELAMSRIKKMYETNEPQGFAEEKFVKLNNEVFDVEVIGIPINYMGEKAIQTIIRDITERKRSQSALSESEEKYRLLFENITQGFALHEIILDDKGQAIDYMYVSANPAFEQLTGIDVKNITGKRITELMSNIEPYWIDTFGKVAINGYPIHYENYASDLDKYYDTWVFSPQKGQFAVIFSDITERKQAENTINAVYNISQMGESNIQDITDFALKETVNLTRSEIAFLAFTNETVNKIKLHSFSKDVFISNEFSNQPLILDLSNDSLFTEAVRTKKPVLINNYEEYENHKELPHWHLKIKRVLVVPIEEDNKVVALATVANKKQNYNETDIHQLTLVIDRLWKTIQSKKYNESIRKLNEDLIDKNKEMEQFVYVTSHDLRSPLVNIQGFTKELVNASKEILSVVNTTNNVNELRGKIDTIYNEDLNESLHYILLSARKMDALLNGLLKLSRMGRIALNIKELNMDKMLRDIISSFNFQIQSKNINVKVSELYNCKADENLLSQVFSNLIDNAVKYMDKDNGGQIIISNEIVNGKIIYCVEDNGPGISKEYHQKIFEIFHRLSTKTEGEGLGLSIVQKIIEKHGGNIRVDSEIGTGSKFFIEIPL
ncbi:MAG: PAS domain S-box protein [Bacteroidales bacterium]|nr:PAS domain S-box protein [Bacteroidales bacterium]